MINELNNLCTQLPESIRYMKKWAKEFAQAERDYYIAKEQATLRFKSEGVPATLIPLLVKGECADELFQMDFKEGMYKAACENVNVLKIQIRVLENQIQREWGEC